MDLVKIFVITKRLELILRLTCDSYNLAVDFVFISLASLQFFYLFPFSFSFYGTVLFTKNASFYVSYCSKTAIKSIFKISLTFLRTLCTKTFLGSKRMTIQKQPCYISLRHSFKSTCLLFSSVLERACISSILLTR